MGIEIFEWTGRIIWWIILSTSIVTVLVSGIIAPLVAYHRIKTMLWQWKYAAILATYGLTQSDLTFIYAVPDLKVPGGDLQQLLAWVERVKERKLVKD
jgi:hypothetical protein